VEHDVSLVSAKAIMAALDPRRYEVVPVGIGRDGRWEKKGSAALLRSNPGLADLLGAAAGGSGRPIDVVFPIVHGTGGEDGALQGLLTLADLPFVGSGVLGSALGMDKAAMKVAFQDAGLPIGRYLVLTRPQWDASPSEAVARAVGHCGLPSFVKPANGGSSVGVSKAKDAAGMTAALRLAFRYDRKVLVEAAIDAREIECSVLGNDDPEVSIAGEIVPAHEFYDYDAKYHDTGSKLIIPAPLTPEQAALLKDLARRAFLSLDLSGMARVDFFLDRRTGVLLLNEVNTLPGFTPISMYPKLWEASGLSFPRLVDRLIRLAFERHAAMGRLVTAFRRGRG
ncbi:MAG TPA: D-alanine--D-alanine ligase family protein, partial [Candidatus Polarisedimenticolia bacterium]|nr:D-alanine--D-alanine ligase family protein [Candidatus Polarisedimenticolia bacterium]